MIRGLGITLFLSLVYGQLQANPHASLFGKKASTLIQLERDRKIIQAMVPQDAYTVRVPLLYPIAHHTIIAWLKDLNLDIASLWDDCIQSQSLQDTINITQQRIIPLKIRQQLLCLQEKLRRASPHLAHYLSMINAHDPLVAFLNQASAKQQLLMVRSSGNEDNPTNPNAGGNESKHHILPTYLDIADALCNVIASYFDPDHALAQRLQAGDDIFQLPTLSVLIQEMVSEQKAFSIVGFSSECRVAQCSAWGVTRLACYSQLFQAVQNDGNGDQIFIDSFGTIMMTAHGLHRTKPLLDQKTIQTIAKLVEGLETYFGYPVDVEMVYQSSAKIINIVQVRPATKQIHNAASYLAKECNILGEAYAITSIASIGNGAVEILEPSNIIIAQSLESAYQEFQTQPNASTKIKVVIVASPHTNSLSHIAIQLASYGIKIIVINDATYQQFLEQKNNKNLLWVIDVQQQQIIIPHTLVNAQKIVANILPGYAKHPATGSWSLFPELLSPSTETYFDITTDMSNPTQADLLATLYTKEGTAAYESLKQLYAQTTRKHPKIDLQQQTRSIATNINLIRHSKNYDLIIAFLAQSINHIFSNKILDKPMTDPLRLFAVGQIETLLTQKKDPSHLNTYSADNIITDYLQDLSFLRTYFNDITTPHVPSDQAWFTYTQKGVRLALTKDVEQDWLTCMNTIASSEPSVQKIYLDLLKTIDNYGIFPLWLHTIFTQRNQKDIHLFINETAQNLLSSQSSLTELFEKQKHLQTYNEQAWGSPEIAQQTLTNITTNILSHACTNKLLSNVMPGANPLNRLIAIAYMKKILNVFDDQGIKTLLRSPTSSHTLTIKSSVFRKAVGEYLKLLESWLPLLVPHISDTIITRYITSLQNIFYKLSAAPLKKTANIFETSLGFDVKQALITQRRIKPITLHDLLTTIHQNASLIINHLTQSSLLNNIQRPPLLNKLEQIILSQQVSIGSSSAHLTLLELHDETCSINYTITPDIHSIDIEMSYNKSTNLATITIEFQGANLVARRWQGLLAFTHATMLSWGKQPLTIQADEQHFKLSLNCTDDDLSLLPLEQFIALLVNLPYAHIANNFTQCSLFIHEQVTRFQQKQKFNTWLTEHCHVDNQFLTHLLVENGLAEQALAYIEKNIERIPEQAIPFLLSILLKSKHTTEHQKKRIYLLLQSEKVAIPFTYYVKNRLQKALCG